MRKLILLIPLLVLSSCYPVKDADKFNNTEPTLQSAEDAMKTNFSEESFNK